MPNRLLKYFGSKKRKACIQPISAQPNVCAFCGQDLKGSHLNAATVFNNPAGTGPLALICSRCIDQLANMSKLTGWYQRYYRNENFWPLLESVIRKRLAGENGTSEMRDAITALLLRLTKRAHAIIAGQRKNGLTECQKTAVPLAPPRIAIITDAQHDLVSMLYAGADVIGLPMLLAEESAARNGSAYEELKQTKCNGDPLHAENGLLIVADGFPFVKDDVGVLYLTATSTGAPEGFELIRLADDADDPFGTAFH